MQNDQTGSDVFESMPTDTNKNTKKKGGGRAALAIVVLLVCALVIGGVYYGLNRLQKEFALAEKEY
ncbi:MAG: hypothetical protein IK064_02835 [Clostridia bacterium]|nr:hypothetical protein [Clostridia bacterium]